MQERRSDGREGADLPAAGRDRAACARGGADADLHVLAGGLLRFLGLLGGALGFQLGVNVAGLCGLHLLQLGGGGQRVGFLLRLALALGLLGLLLVDPDLRLRQHHLQRTLVAFGQRLECGLHRVTGIIVRLLRGDARVFDRLGVLAQTGDHVAQLLRHRLRRDVGLAPDVGALEEVVGGLRQRGEGFEVVGRRVVVASRRQRLLGGLGVVGQDGLVHAAVSLA